MATIQKRADALKAGDVVTLSDYGKCSYLWAERNNFDGVLNMHFASHERKGLIRYLLDENVDTIFYVERPDLTPAQQHAEELARKLELARDTLLNYPNLSVRQFTSARNLAVGESTELLNEIKPPEPPTLEEALQSLEQITLLADAERSNFGKSFCDEAEALLDRARKAGVLK